jgi:hypothetical protein
MQQFDNCSWERVRQLCLDYIESLKNPRELAIKAAAARRNQLRTSRRRRTGNNSHKDTQS